MGMITDPIADALTRVRNAQKVGHKSVSLRGSTTVKAMLEVLKTEGFIENFKEKKTEGKPGVHLDVTLRYYPDGDPMISHADRVSSPGCRVYSNLKELPHVHRGLGIAILSTSQGVMSDREARKRKIGGEVLASVG